MGRRSINTTKSGKYMNPTDQARKEARKRELKKNKRQRMTVRLAVLKSKDPQQLLEEMEKIDQMEYDPAQPPQLNERVLKEKRRKLKETYDRVIHMYEKEDPDFAKDLRKTEVEYEKKRLQMQVYYEQVKNAEKVKLDMIPLPEAPSFQAAASDIPLPRDIPLPSSLPLRSSILKKSFDSRPPLIGPAFVNKKNLKPAGPPPGMPPPLSDLDDDDDDEDDDDDAQAIEGDQSSAKRPSLTMSEKESEDVPSKRRRIRFEDDDTRDPNEVEKDTRLKFKSPAVTHAKSFTNEGINENDEVTPGNISKEIEKEAFELGERKTPNPMPTMLPPGPPPMMFRLPSGAMPPPMLPPRMLPPGPPPRIRPPGIPPPALQGSMAIRGPVPPPGLPPNRSIQASSNQSNILTGIPTFVKQSPTSSNESSSSSPSDRHDSGAATIVAAPKIRNLLGDVTRFTPTALKVKREVKDSKGHAVKTAGRSDGMTKNDEDTNMMRSDDAYEVFMREMKGLI